MRVRDIMTPYPSVVCADEPVSRAARVLRDRRIGMLAVIDDLRSRRLLGVITDHDIVARCVAGGHDFSTATGDHMSRDDLVTVGPDTDAADLVALMQEHRVRRVPVIDDHGRIQGVIALADLATRMTPQDPEVLRAIELRVSGGHATIPS